jgi:hypothetical protein
VDAGLLLAAIYRQTGRLDEAECQLDHIERFDEAAKWALEIDRERRWLASIAKQPSQPSAETNNGD